MSAERATAWQRFTGPGMYPVEYARWLLNPLRYLTMPARPDCRPASAITDGSGPGHWLRPRLLQSGDRAQTVRRLAHAFDAQAPMLKMAVQRLVKHRLTNFTSVCGLADHLPFPNAVFDLVWRSAKADWACWSRPSTTPSRLARRLEFQKLAAGEVVELAGLAAARQAKQQDLCGDVLRRWQRHRILSRHDLCAHPRPRRSRIKQIDAQRRRIGLRRINAGHHIERRLGN